MYRRDLCFLTSHTLPSVPTTAHNTWRRRGWRWEPNEDTLRRGPQTPVSTQHERGTGVLAARTRTCAAVPKRRQENLP